MTKFHRNDLSYIPVAPCVSHVPPHLSAANDKVALELDGAAIGCLKFNPRFSSSLPFCHRHHHHPVTNMVTSNGTSHNDTFTMGPTTKRSDITPELRCPLCSSFELTLMCLLRTCSISRSQLHGLIRAKVREDCRRRIPEAQQGILLLKVSLCREGITSAEHASMSVLALSCCGL